jgi:hypothetical protein
MWLLRPQHERYELRQEITVQDAGSYPHPTIKGFNVNTKGKTEYITKPERYTVVTVYKEEIKKIETHLSYIICGNNAEWLKRQWNYKYPTSPYFQLIILEKV